MTTIYYGIRRSIEKIKNEAITEIKAILLKNILLKKLKRNIYKKD